MNNLAPLTVPFTKASACGNDFLIIRAKEAPADISDFSRRICDRHNGIGADGVEWVSPVEDGTADVAARLINADGSDAEISGNGTRCVAAYWLKKYEGDVVRVLTGAGVKECRFVSEDSGSTLFEMKVGKPVVGEQVVFKLSRPVSGLKIDMGNPQFVVLVEAFDFAWQALGAEIQSQKVFPQGVNVDFVRIVGPQKIESRFFERGAGETQSSGTGSCASAIAAIASGKVKSPVTVVALGGAQQVLWEGPGKDVFLHGPARLVGHGEYFV